jgi:hypothetical protein
MGLIYVMGLLQILPYGLELLTAIREMGHQDPVFSYFLLRGDKEAPQQ